MRGQEMYAFDTYALDSEIICLWERQVKIKIPSLGWGGGGCSGLFGQMKLTVCRGGGGETRHLYARLLPSLAGEGRTGGPAAMAGTYH